MLWQVRQHELRCRNDASSNTGCGVGAYVWLCRCYMPATESTLSINVRCAYHPPHATRAVMNRVPMAIDVGDRRAVCIQCAAMHVSGAHPEPTMSTLFSGSASRCSASSLVTACSAPSIGSCTADRATEEHRDDTARLAVVSTRNDVLCSVKLNARLPVTHVTCAHQDNCYTHLTHSQLARTGASWSWQCCTSILAV
jgi:hypothetical protein